MALIGWVETTTDLEDWADAPLDADALARYLGAAYEQCLDFLPYITVSVPGSRSPRTPAPSTGSPGPRSWSGPPTSSTCRRPPTAATRWTSPSCSTPPTRTPSEDNKIHSWTLTLSGGITLTEA